MAGDQTVLSNNLLDENHASADRPESAKFDNKDVEASTSKPRSTWFGLRSPDKRVRTRAYLIFSVGCLLFVGVILLIIFLAIVPAVVKSLFNESDIIIQTSTIIDPSNDTFYTSTTQTFSKSGPITATVTLSDLAIYWNGKKLADLNDPNKIKVSKDVVTLNATAKVADTAALTEFNSFLISAETFDWQMTGSADVKAIVNVKNLNLDKTITMKGCNNFPQQPVLESVTIVSGTADTLTVDVPAIIYSPASVAIDFPGDLSFSLVYNNTPVGIATLKDYTLASGESHTVARVTMTPKTDVQKALVYEMVTRHTNRLTSPVKFANFYIPTPVTWLSPALNALTLTSTLPGLTTPLVKELTLALQGLTSVNSVIAMYNPFDVPITVTKLVATVIYNGTTLGTLNETTTLLLPSKQTTNSPTFSVPVTISPAILGAVSALAAGTLKVDLQSTLDVLVQNFPAVVPYSQTQVAVKKG